MTPKQDRFCREYVIDLNATQAAIRAGYAATNADVTGPRLLGNVGVAARIAELQREATDKLELDERWVLERLQHEATLDDSPPAARVRAVELIGKHRGMFVERHAGADGGPILTEDLTGLPRVAREQRLAAVKAKLMGARG